MPTEEYKGLKIGVLALQGAFNKHVKALKKVGVTPFLVKTSADLFLADGLIIPGGESTVMMRLIDSMRMREALQKFSQKKPILGTCAGLIVLAKEVQNAPFTPLGILSVSVKRNGFGRQIASHRRACQIKEGQIEGIFIRAPRIENVLSKAVETLGTVDHEAVWIQEGVHMGTTFHPELTEDLTIHTQFIGQVAK
ncbi:MAG: pyridoxal 5'-phosphate synthase glutaminase subunit PdxT [Chlamydiia bacterium]|nr:pyridoxal 5'-phosphate synthase glutaminase subunit PdxT [Chlamydiia bacterium]